MHRAESSAPSTTPWSPSPIGMGEEQIGGQFLPRSRGRGTAKRWRGRWSRALALAAFAGPALAHEGHHETLTLAEQARHLLTQPDHILAFAGLVVLAVAGTWHWRVVRAKARK